MGMKGAPNSVENVGCGSVMPRSVPASLEVKPGYKVIHRRVFHPAG